MNFAAVLLVTAVVWAISLIRSVSTRAFVYSLPLPMTLALLTTEFEVDGAQVIGVVGLNLFFLTVTVLHHRLRWNIILSDLLGVAVYVALSAALLVFVPVPFAPALIAVLAIWGLAMFVLRRRAARSALHGPGTTADRPESDRSESDRTGQAGGARRSDHVHDRVEGSGGPPADERNPGRQGLPPFGKLLVIFMGSNVTVVFGQLLQGMVVTFPYSGVLVAFETRRHLAEFSRHFARNSIALVAFIAGYYWLRNGPESVALAGAWGAFAATALALRLPRLRRAAIGIWRSWTRGRSAASAFPGRPGAPGPTDRPADGVEPDNRGVDQPHNGHRYITGPASDRLAPRKAAPGGQ
nr:hypothetical protein [Micromonospora sp. DSM 115978]